MSSMMGSPGAPSRVDDVLITHELVARPSRPPNHAAEARALAALAQELATNPGRVSFRNIRVTSL